MDESLPPGYRLRSGSSLERPVLLKFIQKTYQELFPEGEFSHLGTTIEHYLSRETPLWWVECEADSQAQSGLPSLSQIVRPIGCLWLGNAIDQVSGQRHTHIFLLYVAPEHRRRGIGSALVHHAEAWARTRGDLQIGLQVFQANQPALSLYQTLGYQTQSLWMVKPL